MFLGIRLSRHDRRSALDRAWRSVAKLRDDKDAEAVLGDLRAKTAAWAHNPDGLTEMRTELMDSVDRGLIHHALLELEPTPAQKVLARMPALPGSHSELGRLIEASDLRVDVIRYWAGVYYGDRAVGDWFDTYRRAAKMRQPSVLRDLERIAGDPPTATHNNIDAAIRGLNTSLRLRLLQAPRGKRIGRRGLFSRLRQLFNPNSSPDADEPSQTSPFST